MSSSRLDTPVLATPTGGEPASAPAQSQSTDLSTLGISRDSLSAETKPATPKTADFDPSLKVSGTDLDVERAENAKAVLGLDLDKVASDYKAANEALAARHEELQNAGFEDAAAPAGIPNLLRSAGAGGSSVRALQQQELAQSEAMLLAGKSKKKTGNREVDDFIELHPELLPLVAKIQEELAAIERARSGGSNGLESKSNLEAALDRVATLLEGQPLAPELRMGDRTARNALLALVDESLRDSCEAALDRFAQSAVRSAEARRLDVTERRSENVAERSRELEEIEKQAQKIGRERGAILAAPRPPAVEALQELELQRRELERRIQALLGGAESAQAHLAAVLKQSEDAARAQVVSEHIYELARDVRLLEGRRGQSVAHRAALERLAEYRESQGDLIQRNAAVRDALTRHEERAVLDAVRLLRNADAAALNLYTAAWGWGTDENVLLATLKGRSEFELKLLKEVYREQYQQSMDEMLAAEINRTGTIEKQIWAAANGDPNHRGGEVVALSATELSAAAPERSSATIRAALVSSDQAQLLAVELHERIAVSADPALELAQIRERAGTAGLSLQEIERAGVALGFQEVLPAIEHRSKQITLDSSSSTQLVALSASRNEQGLALARALLDDTALDNERFVAYAQVRLGEYAVSKGEILGGRNPSSQTLTALDRELAQLKHLLGLSDEDGAALEEHIASTVGRAREMRIVSDHVELAYAAGLRERSADAEEQAERKYLQEKLAELQAAQAGWIAERAELKQRLGADVARATEFGRQRGDSVDQAVLHFSQAIWLLGTTEEKALGALEGLMSADERSLFKSRYARTQDETIEKAAEGDFSGAELDKVSALLRGDKVAALAADAEIAIDDDDASKLQATLRGLLTPAQRNDFGAVYSDRYAGGHSTNGAYGSPVESVKTFERVLELRLRGDERIIAQALYTGNNDLADAALLHQHLAESEDVEAAAKHLEAVVDDRGWLDAERLGRIEAAAKKQYNASPLAFYSDMTEPEGRWIAALLAADQIEAGIRKLDYAIETDKRGRVDDVNTELVRETFVMPEYLKAMARRAERGEPLSEAEAQLYATESARWSDYRREVEGGYRKVNNGADLRDHLAAELGAHELRVTERLIDAGRLTSVEAIIDAMAGAGTVETVLEEETAGLSKAQATKLKSDYNLATEGRDLLSDIDGETSGHLEFDLNENLRGRPETAQELLEAAKRRYEHETSWSVEWGAYELDAKAHADLEALKLAVEQGRMSDAAASFERFRASADQLRGEKQVISDTVVSYGTTTVMVVGTVVLVVGTAGTGAAAVPVLTGFVSKVGLVGGSAIVAGASGAVRMGGKSLFLGAGQGYGGEEFAADLGITGVEAVVAVAGVKVSVGNKLASMGTEAIAKRAATQSAIGVADDGARLGAGEVATHLASSSRMLRMTSGAVAGGVDGVIIAPAQAAGVAAFDEHTWNEGVGQGFLNLGSTAFNPHTLMFGGLLGIGAGGGISAFSPQAIRNGQILRGDSAAKVRASAQTAEAAELIAQRESTRGFLSHGDAEAVKLANVKLSQDKSAQILQSMRDAPAGTFDESQIGALELRLKERGYLTEFDRSQIGADLAGFKGSQRPLSAKESRSLLERIESAPEGRYTPEQIKAYKERLAQAGHLTEFDLVRSVGRGHDQVTIVRESELARRVDRTRAELDSLRTQLDNPDLPSERRLHLEGEQVSAQRRLDSLTELKSSHEALREKARQGLSDPETELVAGGPAPKAVKYTKGEAPKVDGDQPVSSRAEELSTAKHHAKRVAKEGVADDGHRLTPEETSQSKSQAKVHDGEFKAGLKEAKGNRRVDRKAENKIDGVVDSRMVSGRRHVEQEAIDLRRQLALKGDEALPPEVRAKVAARLKTLDEVELPLHRRQDRLARGYFGNGRKVSDAVEAAALRVARLEADGIRGVPKYEAALKELQQAKFNNRIDLQLQKKVGRIEERGWINDRVVAEQELAKKIAASRKVGAEAPADPKALADEISGLRHNVGILREADRIARWGLWRGDRITAEEFAAAKRIAEHHATIRDGTFSSEAYKSAWRDYFDAWSLGRATRRGESQQWEIAAAKWSDSRKKVEQEYREADLAVKRSDFELKKLRRELAQSKSAAREASQDGRAYDVEALQALKERVADARAAHAADVTRLKDIERTALTTERWADRVSRYYSTRPMRDSSEVSVAETRTARRVVEMVRSGEWYGKPTRFAEAVGDFLDAKHNARVTRWEENEVATVGGRNWGGERKLLETEDIRLKAELRRRGQSADEREALLAQQRSLESRLAIERPADYLARARLPLIGRHIDRLAQGRVPLVSRHGDNVTNIEFAAAREVVRLELAGQSGTAAHAAAKADFSVTRWEVRQVRRLESQPWIPDRTLAEIQNVRLEAAVRRLRGDPQANPEHVELLNAKVAAHREGALADSRRIDFLARKNGHGTVSEVAAATRVVKAERQLLLDSQNETALRELLAAEAALRKSIGDAGERIAVQRDLVKAAKAGWKSGGAAGTAIGRGGSDGGRAGDDGEPSPDDDGNGPGSAPIDGQDGVRVPTAEELRLDFEAPAYEPRSVVGGGDDSLVTADDLRAAFDAPAYAGPAPDNLSGAGRAPSQGRAQGSDTPLSPEVLVRQAKVIEIEEGLTASEAFLRRELALLDEAARSATPEVVEVAPGLKVPREEVQKGISAQQQKIAQLRAERDIAVQDLQTRQEFELGQRRLADERATAGARDRQSDVERAESTRLAQRRHADAERAFQGDEVAPLSSEAKKLIDRLADLDEEIARSTALLTRTRSLVEQAKGSAAGDIVDFGHGVKVPRGEVERGLQADEATLLRQRAERTELQEQIGRQLDFDRLMAASRADSAARSTELRDRIARAEASAAEIRRSHVARDMNERGAIRSDGEGGIKQGEPSRATDEEALPAQQRSDASTDGSEGGALPRRREPSAEPQSEFQTRSMPQSEPAPTSGGSRTRVQLLEREPNPALERLLAQIDSMPLNTPGSVRIPSGGEVIEPSPAIAHKLTEAQNRVVELEATHARYAGRPEVQREVAEALTEARRVVASLEERAMHQSALKASIRELDEAAIALGDVEARKLLRRQLTRLESKVNSDVGSTDLETLARELDDLAQSVRAPRAGSASTESGAAEIGTSRATEASEDFLPPGDYSPGSEGPAALGGGDEGGGTATLTKLETKTQASTKVEDPELEILTTTETQAPAPKPLEAKPEPKTDEHIVAPPIKPVEEIAVPPTSEAQTTAGATSAFKLQPRPNSQTRVIPKVGTAPLVGAVTRTDLTPLNDFVPPGGPPPKVAFRDEPAPLARQRDDDASSGGRDDQKRRPEEPELRLRGKPVEVTGPKKISARDHEARKGLAKRERLVGEVVDGNEAFLQGDGQFGFEKLTD